MRQVPNEVHIIVKDAASLLRLLSWLFFNAKHDLSADANHLTENFGGLHDDSLQLALVKAQLLASTSPHKRAVDTPETILESATHPASEVIVTVLDLLVAIRDEITLLGDS